MTTHDDGGLTEPDDVGDPALTRALGNIRALQQPAVVESPAARLARERARFEAWWRVDLVTESDYVLARRSDGHYVWSRDEQAWRAWCAALGLDRDIHA